MKDCGKLGDKKWESIKSFVSDSKIVFAFRPTQIG